MKKKGNPMLLKIGELAKRTGLTVRTLHYYDALKLLSPSARTDAGYRLYNPRVLAREWMTRIGRDTGGSPVLFAKLNANMGKRSAEWLPLIARVRAAMDAGHAPESKEAQGLAREWFDLFRSFAGDNPATQRKIGAAMENEPELSKQGGVDGAMRQYMRVAVTASAPSQAA
jgi:hypothetical protein